jgi:UPF0755 protein
MASTYIMKSGNKRRWPRALLITGIIALALIICSVLVIRRTYEHNLRPVSSSQQSQDVTIPLGASVKEIAQILDDAKLIREAWAFEWYVRNNDARDALQAGTYPLRPNQSVQEIVAILTNGKVSTNLVTILPGRRIDEVKDTLVNYGFDEKEVEAALEPDQYASHPALVDKPKGASLEGYIFPESFQKTAATRPEILINAALDELQTVLTPDLRAGLVRQGLTVHQGIILASIVEKESGTEEDKPTIAQVFLKRLREGRPLESDATAGYGAVLSGEFESLTHAQVISYDSAYNTYRHKGLPPGPVSNFTLSSIMAVANPSPTNFLYFVADDDGEDKGKSFFSRTLAEHEANVAEHCKILCR